MAVLLLLAAILGIGAEQLRIALSQKFRLRMQTEFLQALTFESGEMRAQRQTGEMIKIFTSDAAGVSALLIFGILGIFESGAKGVDLRHRSVRVSRTDGRFSLSSCR